jgi:hypothetical protein
VARGKYHPRSNLDFGRLARTTEELIVMPQIPEPTRPSDVYRAIIDQLVHETREYGAGTQVAKSSIFSKAPAHGEFNEFIASLSVDHRELLSRMLQEERDGAIHDVLAMLTWWILCRGVGLTFKGEPMPVDLSGMGLHGDYIGRRDGWSWPKDSDLQGR